MMKHDKDKTKAELIAELESLRFQRAKSEEGKYQQIVEGLPQFIFELDRTGQLSYANEFALKSYGYSKQDLTQGITLSDIIHPDSYSRVMDNLFSIFTGTGIQGEEYLALRKDGSTFPIKVYSQRITKKNRVMGMRGVVIDITDIKQVEKALLRSENYYRTLFENTGTATVIITPDSIIKSCNSQYEKLSGYTAEEIEGKKSWSDFVDPSELERMRRYHDSRKLETGRAPDNYEFTFMARNGILKTVHVCVGVIAGTNDRVCSLIDISSHNEALLALRQSEERYQLVARGANDGIWDWDLTTDTVYYSTRYKEIIGYTDEEFPNNADSWRNNVHPEDVDRCVAANMKCINGETDQFQVEFRMFHKDGSIRWILGRGGSAKDENRKPYRLSGTHTDITEAKQAMQALRESEERYRDIFENATDGIYQCTLDGRFLAVNSALARNLGYDSPEEMLRSIKNVRQDLWVIPENRTKFIRELQEKGTLQNYEQHIKRKDGSTLWISENVRAIYNDEGAIEYYEGFLQDITKRKFNESTTNALYAISSAISTTHDLPDLYGAIHAIIDNVISANNFFICLADEKQDMLRFVYFRDEMDDYYDIKDISDPKKSSLAIHVYRSGSPLLMSRDCAKDRKLLKTIGLIGTPSATWLGVPLRLGGKVVGVMAVQDYQNPFQYTDTDVTFMTAVSEQVAMAIERKANEEALESKVDKRTAELQTQAAELENANKRLRELDKIKSALVSSVSHELRTPLTSIRGFAKLCARDFTRHFLPLTKDDTLVHKGLRIRDNLGIIDTEGERLTRLINDFLDINRIESGKASWHDSLLNPCEIITQATTAASGSFAANSEVELVTDLPPKAHFVHADPDKMHQVLINLLNNAYKFTRQGTVSVSLREMTDSLILSISDTGSGIPERELPFLFNKFHKASTGDTVRIEDRGTGLGLSICKEIVEHYGGSIWVESKLGAGSTFYFSIPFTRETNRADS